MPSIPHRKKKPLFWLVRSYLVLLIFIYAILTCETGYYFWMTSSMAHLSFYHHLFAFLTLFYLIGICGFILLFFLYKKGFWFVIFSTVTILTTLQLYLHPPVHNLISGFGSTILLFVLLHLGGKKAMWRAMKK